MNGNCKCNANNSGEKIAVALLGYGTVGGGTGKVLTANSESIKNRVGKEIFVKYICDLRDFPDDPLGDRVVHDFNIILNDPEVTVVAEMMGGSHPAFDFSLAALKAGKNVVTSNKQVVAEFGDVLLEEAHKNGVRYLFEASVGGGIPVLSPLHTCLCSNVITGITGILNGTTNFILTQMNEKGVSFADALKDAQARGYAEADPTADVEGYDARRKICILSALAFGKMIPDPSVRAEGITAISAETVKAAEKKGYAVKLIARARKLEDGKIFMSVEPFAVVASNPLAHVSDVFNAVTVTGNAVGDVMFYGPGAGSLPTASAVAADIIEIASGNKDDSIRKIEWTREENVYVSSLPEEIEQAEYETLGIPLSKLAL